MYDVLHMFSLLRIENDDAITNECSNTANIFRMEQQHEPRHVNGEPATNVRRTARRQNDIRNNRMP